MNGLITIWKGPVINKTYTNNSITYSYYVPSIPNWYVCDGSKISEDFTTPNMVGYIPVGLSPTDIININGDISGNVSLCEDIPINNHTHSLTITTSNYVHDISCGTPVGSTVSTYANAANTEIAHSVVHEHNIINGLYGTTNFNINVTTNSTGDTNRLKYIAEYFIIYYASVPIINFFFKGMIYQWYGNITTSYPYQPIDSSNNILENWYICSSLNNNSSIPDMDNNIVVISVSGYTTINNNSTTIREAIDIESHTHSINSVTSSISTVGTDDITYYTNKTVSINNATLTSLYNKVTSPVSTTEYFMTSHNHNIDITSYNFDKTITTPSLSDSIFKYINLYYIIYLPP